MESLKRRAFNPLAKLLLVSLIVFVASAHVYAGTVRGRLERRDGYGRNYMAGGVGVTLYSQQQGRSAPAYTGNDGMYYLYNVPPGKYYLEVWAYQNREPLRYEIYVDNRSLFDINPILIP